MNFVTVVMLALGLITSPAYASYVVEEKPVTALEAHYVPTEPSRLPPLNVTDASLLIANEKNKEYVKGRIETEFNTRMVRIVRCESNFDQYRDGKILVSKTNDVGVMQINLASWLKKSKEMGLDIYQLEDNIKMGKYILEVQGLSAWVCNSLI